jgi:hypothetical protein
MVSIAAWIVFAVVAAGVIALLSWRRTHR